MILVCDCGQVVISHHATAVPSNAHDAQCCVDGDWAKRSRCTEIGCRDGGACHRNGLQTCRRANTESFASQCCIFYNCFLSHNAKPVAIGYVDAWIIDPIDNDIDSRCAGTTIAIADGVFKTVGGILIRTQIIENTIGFVGVGAIARDGHKST